MIGNAVYVIRITTGKVWEEAKHNHRAIQEKRAEMAREVVDRLTIRRKLP